MYICQLAQINSRETLPPRCACTLYVHDLRADHCLVAVHKARSLPAIILWHWTAHTCHHVVSIIWSEICLLGIHGKNSDLISTLTYALKMYHIHGYKYWHILCQFAEQSMERRRLVYHFHSHTCSIRPTCAVYWLLNDYQMPGMSGWSLAYIRPHDCGSASVYAHRRVLTTSSFTLSFTVAAVPTFVAMVVAVIIPIT